MKLLIDVDEEVYDALKRVGDYLLPTSNNLSGKVYQAVANGKPYDTTGDCISRDALKEAVKTRFDNSAYFPFRFLALIDNAEAIPLPNEQVAWERGYEAGLAQGKQDRPKGEWINHRNDYGHNIADCSLCGKTMQWHDEDGDGIPRYCWYCGADMRKGGAE